MMRNMSFALTTEQIKRKTKTVTRRLGWKNLKAGTLLQPVEKCQGLKKGEKVQKIGGPIKVVNVRRERLDAIIEHSFYGRLECEREGFPTMAPEEFAHMFCFHNRCQPWDEVTRIEFEYL